MCRLVKVPYADALLMRKSEIKSPFSSNTVMKIKFIVGVLDTLYGVNQGYSIFSACIFLSKNFNLRLILRSARRIRIMINRRYE